jgi:hypothetical protein
VLPTAAGWSRDQIGMEGAKLQYGYNVSGNTRYDLILDRSPHG